MILSFIENLGLLGIFFVVFAESGLFFGFFFPGDSLLFTAGLLAASGFFSVTYLIIGCALAAALGGMLGYFAYDMGFTLEKIAQHATDDLKLPDCILPFYDWVLYWDHKTKESFILWIDTPKEKKRKIIKENILFIPG